MAPAALDADKKADASAIASREKVSIRIWSGIQYLIRMRGAPFHGGASQVPAPWSEPAGRIAKA